MVEGQRLNEDTWLAVLPQAVEKGIWIFWVETGQEILAVSAPQAR
jgi:hypothetical protein